VSEAELYVTSNSSLALPWRWRLLSGAAWFVSLALLAWVLAYWGWRWFGPTPVSIQTAVPEGDWARRIAEAGLFGTAATGSPNVEPSANIGELRLLGVFAERDGKGYALFRAGARGPLLVAVGHEVASGIRLDAVRPDAVTLVEGGVRREIALRTATPAIDKGSAVASVANTRSVACPAPAGFTGQVIRLNAELLGGMINAPDAWKALLQAAPGALIVRDQSGFAGMLGLKNGDRVERANGIALAIPEDVATTVLQPLTKSQPVWLIGTRDGKPQQWLYLNAGACPA